MATIGGLGAGASVALAAARLTTITAHESATQTVKLSEHDHSATERPQFTASNGDPLVPQGHSPVRYPYLAKGGSARPHTMEAHTSPP